MKIAITGCNGAIGRRAVLWALKEGHTVVGADNIVAQDAEFYNNPAFSFHQVDLKDFDAALKAFEGCDAVIQLAALLQPMDYLVKVHNDNVVIAWNVLRAAAELGIDRVAVASSVNVLRAVIGETQADTIVRRYPTMRVASMRIHKFISTRTRAYGEDRFSSRGDLWSYVQMDSTADALLRAVTVEKDRWTGHEAFFIVAPQLAVDDDWLELKAKYFPDTPVKPDWVESGGRGFFDCSKAERLLGWVHKDYA
ncbi:NAD(P)-binding protein [Rhizopogon vinicolor AM-OR11-026]|uniref:NAD(P)-binding protein n=1 Tax=Rhizopogon vinicolor AM-OR11-026 TaxID=1314800 RepID=A0A1B7MYD8_9AGAM|nr:NAD(P)-binding protein [Rhizopogon vinicolor AM-OR11-026]